MRPNDEELTKRASEIFAMNGGSWRDYALISDIEPPRIVRALPSLGLLDIADELLAQACRHYLVEQGAQTFASFDELTSAFGICQAANDGMTTYTSPAGFYTVQHPSDWRVSREENIVNIYPPDESGSVTISAFRGDGVSPLVLRGLIERTFKNYETVSSLRPISQNNWMVCRQSFPSWLIRACEHGWLSARLTGRYWSLLLRTTQRRLCRHDGKLTNLF